MKITKNMLKTLKACKTEIDTFKGLFPKGLNMRTFDYGVVESLWEKGLNVQWFFVKILGDKKYRSISEKYEGWKLDAWEVTGYTWNSPPDSWEAKLYVPLRNAINDLRNYALAKATFDTLERKEKRAKGAKNG